MKIFEHPNTSDNWVCPICKTNADKQVTLIALPQKSNELVVQAEQFHVHCVMGLEFTYLTEHSVIAAYID